MLNQETGNGRTTVLMTSRQTQRTQTAVSHVYAVVIMPSVLGRSHAFGGVLSRPAALMLIRDTVVQFLDLKDKKKSLESERGSSIRDQYLSAGIFEWIKQPAQLRNAESVSQKRKRTCRDTLQMSLSPACAPACAPANAKACSESWP